MSSVDCTQNGLYNLKQYDHYKIKISNDLVHITLLYNICGKSNLVIITIYMCVCWVREGRGDQRTLLCEYLI